MADETEEEKKVREEKEAKEKEEKEKAEREKAGEGNGEGEGDEPSPPSKPKEKTITSDKIEPPLEKSELYGKPDTEINSCGKCGAKFEGRPKYCPNCAEEFDYN